MTSAEKYALILLTKFYKVMKKFLLSLAIMMMAFASAFAQVPTVMMYQVQIKHGKASAQNVTVQMQLRNSQNGSAVWSQTFELKDVKNGSVQNLGLDFGDKVNLNNGEYWLATIVDGQEMGCAKLTSVPYALVAKEVEGGINMSNIVGEWKNTDTKNPATTERVLSLKEDGTFYYKYSYKDSKYSETKICEGTYRVLANGIIYSYSANSDDVQLCDEVARIDNDHLMFMSDDGRFGKMYIYTRQ